MATTKRISPVAMSLGFVIERLRKERGWQILTLSERTSFNRGYLGELEKGYSTPTLETLFTLASAFGVRPSEMLREAEERLPGKWPS
jgi:transcriptional regulator with XRE-family HTH domain